MKTITQNQDRPRFVRAKELAQRLGLHSRTIFRWADAGVLKRRKVNARVVFFDMHEVALLVGEAKRDSDHGGHHV